MHKTKSTQRLLQMIKFEFGMVMPPDYLQASPYSTPSLTHPLRIVRSCVCR